MAQMVSCPKCGGAAFLLDWGIRCSECGAETVKGEQTRSPAFRTQNGPTASPTQSAAPAARTANSERTSEEEPPPVEAQPASRPRPVTFASGGRGNAGRSPRFSGQLQQPTSLLDVFDFKFEKYLTPWIVRATWVAVLSCAVLWVLTIGFGTIASWMPERKHETASETRAVEFRAPDVEPPLWLRKRVWTTLAGITSCVGVVIGVLWVRVALEAVIVLFNMAKSLNSIDDKLSD